MGLVGSVTVMLIPCFRQYSRKRCQQTMLCRSTSSTVTPSLITRRPTPAPWIGRRFAARDNIDDLLLHGLYTSLCLKAEHGRRRWSIGPCLSIPGGRSRAGQHRSPARFFLDSRISAEMAALSHLGSKREALFPWISGQDAGLIATASGKRRLLADEGDVLWRGQAGTGGRLIFGIASFMLSAAHDRLDRRARLAKRVATGGC